MFDRDAVVERMAEAIYAGMFGPHTQWADDTPRQHDRMRKIARAALAIAEEAVRAERDRYKARGDNHAETLRGIARMNPKTEAERMVLWARDGLSGYTQSVEETLKDAYDERNTIRARVAELEGALRPFAAAILLADGHEISLERGWFETARAVLEPRHDPSAERHMTPSEQRAMNRALVRSAKMEPRHD